MQPDNTYRLPASGVRTGNPFAEGPQNPITNVTEAADLRPHKRPTLRNVRPTIKRQSPDSLMKS